MTWVAVRGRGVRLQALDFGGEGPAALLLHGLAGTAVEWANTAGWLTATHRVVALDQRGHGRSERRPDDLSRRAFVEDAAAAIEQLGLAPVTLIGQSLGGHTAFLVAARRPELLRALVVAEASRAEAEAAAPARVGELLADWPVPFPSAREAQEFFGGATLRGRTWAGSLDSAEDGLRPPFDVDVMVAALEAATGADYLDEWRTIQAPTLLVRAEQGDLDAEEADAMARTLPSARLVTLAGAGHDVHLDAPAAWRGAVEEFLAGFS